METSTHDAFPVETYTLNLSPAAKLRVDVYVDRFNTPGVSVTDIDPADDEYTPPAVTIAFL